MQGTCRLFQTAAECLMELDEWYLFKLFDVLLKVVQSGAFMHCLEWIWPVTMVIKCKTFAVLFIFYWSCTWHLMTVLKLPCLYLPQPFCFSDFDIICVLYDAPFCLFMLITNVWGVIRLVDVGIVMTLPFIHLCL